MRFSVASKAGKEVWGGWGGRESGGGGWRGRGKGGGRGNREEEERERKKKQKRWPAAPIAVEGEMRKKNFFVCVGYFEVYSLKVLRSF